VNKPDDAATPVKVEFVPVGRHRREWRWTARDESNRITISGQHFDSLSDAVRDARERIDGQASFHVPDDDPPFAA
jgi:hypothetical protein